MKGNYLKFATVVLIAFGSTACIPCWGPFGSVCVPTQPTPKPSPEQGHQDGEKPAAMGWLLGRHL